MLLLASMQSVYELMVVLRPDFGVDEKPIKDLVAKFIGDRELKTLIVMGKKRLAYPIKKQVEGVYTVATFAGSPLKVVELEKQLKMGVDILRYLLIAKDPAFAKASAGTPAGENAVVG